MLVTEITPPYLRIAAEIRRRIEDGELAPGERVPSTRRLAAEWNVALATATKALTALRQEGTVTARPRVGTVVAERSRVRRQAAPTPPRRAEGEMGRELSRERVVRAAVALADAEGLGALSMRAVAARLGTAAMSPYRHVEGKDHLVRLMTDAVYGELELPRPAPEFWRDRLEAGARALWELHRAHPWLAHAGPINRPLMAPNVLAYSDWILGALEGLGLPPSRMFDVNVLLYGYVQGLAVHLEREAHAEAASGMTEDEWLAGQEREMAGLVTPDAYPSYSRWLASLGEEGYDLSLDTLFTTGLSALLTGLASTLP
ncbi:GntR family transcriptional regulator [Streptomyces albiaxialis]|uniref:GntR family transcriptional regulator n=1 Tax=Streptomyces albiaxialis TaxID=329523 RepID=A0ABP5HN35_9ACTN